MLVNWHLKKKKNLFMDNLCYLVQTHVTLVKVANENTVTFLLKSLSEKATGPQNQPSLSNQLFWVTYVDKFYTSIPLALHHLQKGLYICGSFDIRRKHWPKLVFSLENLYPISTIALVNSYLIQERTRTKNYKLITFEL